jgi:hypothetical protein
VTFGQPSVSSEPPSQAPEPPAPAAEPAAAAGPLDRPELLVGAAFAGGLVLAFVLRRITS